MNKLIGKKLLIFDLETTGFPIKRNGFNIGKNEYNDYNENDKYDSSRIVSIAWTFFDNFGKNNDNFNIIEKIRKPVDFNEINNSNIHNITYEIAKKDGMLLSKILRDEGFLKCLYKCDFIVAHNCMFDVHVLLNELYRLKFNKAENILKNLLDNDKCFCTGELGRELCKIPIKPNKYFNYKMPKLSEFYKYIIGDDLTGMHNAKNDVMAICKILNKLVLK
jgi:DNA polymerase III epsilon subunit-like protein